MMNTRRTTAISVSLLTLASAAYAGEQSLDCKLYIAEALDHASSNEVDSSESLLNSLRRGGVCLFPDGRVADKQFAMAVNARNAGARGDAVGISIYTFENGDSLTLSFIGGWDNGPFNGDYQIMEGTGAFTDASGTGTISGTDSPWQSTSVVYIHIEITTPGS